MPTSRPILFVTRNFPPAQGGIETLTLELMRHGFGRGERVVVAHFGQQACKPPPSGVAAYHHLPGSGRWPSLLSAALFVPWLALRHRPRLIVNIQVTTALGSRLARLFTGAPYIVLGMGLELLPGGAFWWRLLRGLVLRGAARVISISRYTDSLAAAFRVPASRRSVVNPGTRLFQGHPAVRDRAALYGPGAEGAFLILSLSRLVPRKGVDKAIEALALVAKTRTDFIYAIAGTGPDRPRLEALAAEKGLGRHVRFLGRLADADMGPTYAEADLFLLPSRSTLDPPDAEGFGIVFLEAGACGTPSIGGNSGGVPDAVLDGKTGFLVDPEDPAAIAEKILLLLSDRGLLRKLGQQAHAHAEASSWDKSAARYFEAFGDAA
jgi:phosphatidyl-myo-inositol dimannoside synthase